MTIGFMACSFEIWGYFAHYQRTSIGNHVFSIITSALIHFRSLALA